jgi:uncharacterized membrane protein YphA (DoxX/SURF4 family)/thiol-disulfide isomerase/thioredoxin
METLVIGLRLVLAGVLGTAGVAKLLDLSGSRQALEDFGVPLRLARPGGVLLPISELVIAVSLLFPPTARWGALAAAGLLGLFVVVIANALAHGRAPDCHCFGQLSSEPAGWGTLLRNGILIALAVTVVALGPGPDVIEWLAERTALDLAILAIALVAVGFGVLVWRRWKKRQARLRLVRSAVAALEAQREPGGRSPGSQAPPFTLRGVSGEETSLETLRARGRPVVLVFVQSGCGPCRQLLPHLAEWQVTLAGSLTIAVLSEGGVDANRPLVEEHGITDFLLQERGEVYREYEVRSGTPAATVVDPDGTITGPTVGGHAAIEGLIRLTLRRSDSTEQPSLTG